LNTINITQNINLNQNGKQHQLRVHLNYLGIPILNDPFYPVVAHKADDDF
jgi:tRNA pseudouridine32 synthase/23S rRNA pseudouridine746 synthase